jgi:hypothetical protein
MMSQMNTEKSFVNLELENVTNVNPVLEKSAPLGTGQLSIF